MGLCGAVLAVSYGWTSQNRLKVLPDVETASSVAKVILERRYGSKQISQELPLRVKLVGDIWHVTGTLTAGSDGGVAEIWINQVDCKVVRLTHGR